tara:strand:+ start:3491 stop:3802 length:312 start_codon:yes stop_codon:yes gene_type:complete
MDAYDFDRTQSLLSQELERLHDIKNSNLSRLQNSDIEENQHLADVKEKYLSEQEKENESKRERNNKIKNLIEYIDNTLKYSDLDETTRLSGENELRNLKNLLY